jgi:hypothetical protein
VFAPSVYPYVGAGFFLENPTAMFRVSAFEALRGFGDYGDLDCNKCGLDTEFYARAFYSGARFAISRRVVVDYRVHRRGPFDPRLLGALRSAPGVTQRLGGRHRGSAT